MSPTWGGGGYNSGSPRDPPAGPWPAGESEGGTREAPISRLSFLGSAGSSQRRDWLQRVTQRRAGLSGNPGSPPPTGLLFTPQRGLPAHRCPSGPRPSLYPSRALHPERLLPHWSPTPTPALSLRGATLEARSVIPEGPHTAPTPNKKSDSIPWEPHQAGSLNGSSALVYPSVKWAPSPTDCD